MKSIIQLLKDAGVTNVSYMSDDFPDLLAIGAIKRKQSINGTLPAEPYDAGRDHFTPTFRQVSVQGPTHGRQPDGTRTPTFFYVTSCIHGTMRGYRCRHTYDTQVANIFARAPTKRAAVIEWIRKYQAKEYNVRR